MLHRSSVRRLNCGYRLRVVARKEPGKAGAVDKAIEVLKGDVPEGHSRCGQRAPRYDRRPVRCWLHVPWGGTAVWLRYAPWRVACRRCGVRVEQVALAVGQSAFTAPFEELAAYLSQVTDQTTVSRLLAVSWPAVGSIVHRVVARRLDAGRFDGLTRIGIDEFSYRKRHHYLTVVVDHDRRRVVWAGEGRSARTLDAFFDRFGSAGCARIALVTVERRNDPGRHDNAGPCSLV